MVVEIFDIFYFFTFFKNRYNIKRVDDFINLATVLEIPKKILKLSQYNLNLILAVNEVLYESPCIVC